LKKVQRIFVSFGGTDPTNVTGMVLEGIKKAGFNERVDVVLGSGAPYLKAVQVQAAQMTAAVKVHVASQHIAELMTRADLAVGAGGVTSWERCALGLPCIIITTAKNQESIAAELARIGAARYLGRSVEVDIHCLADELCALIKRVKELRTISRIASLVCGGNGAGRVVENLIL
jgi:spore coat polysaccharide biosynthesis predicted glycosyltransferase SpsG